ncbi:MAG: tetratricopeptide repeat protein [Dongiaceae bacterium]
MRSFTAISGPSSAGWAVWTRRSSASVRRSGLIPVPPPAISPSATPCRAKGDLDGAIASFREGAAVQPGNPAPHVNLGNALRAAGRLGESTVSLREAVRLDPNLPEAHHNLGVVLSRRGSSPRPSRRFAPPCD